MRLSQLATDAQVNALTALLAGGELRIYDGQLPSAFDSRVVATPLVSFKVGNWPPSKSGVSTLTKLTATVLVDGTAKWYRWVDAAGRTIAEDECGVDVIVQPNFVIRGSTATVERIVIDMEG